MNGDQTLDGLEFQDHLLLDNDVDAIAAVEADRFVQHRQRHLPSKNKAALLQLVTEAFLIRRLQKTRPELPVDFNGEANNLLGKGIASLRRKHRLNLSLPLW